MKDITILQRELFNLLHREGAKLVGFANLKSVPNATLPIGVSVVIPLPAQIIDMVEEYPTQAYYDTYLSYNHQLDWIVRVGEMYLNIPAFESHPVSS